MKNKILFLDYDDVVNIPMWNEKGTQCKYNHPVHNKVNDFQAVQWVSEFCCRFHYDIVVCSSWRDMPNYKECLINGGLRDGIEIVGATDDLSYLNGSRGDEIEKWLSEHPEVKYYIIFDDGKMNPNQEGHHIKTRVGVGFTYEDYFNAEKIAVKDIGHRNSFWDREEKQE